MTIGGTDTSLYSGSINWVDIILPASYWSIPLQGELARRLPLCPPA